MNYNVLSIFCADFGSTNLISRIFQELNRSLPISVLGPRCNRTVRVESYRLARRKQIWWRIILRTESDWLPRICHMICCSFLTRKGDFYLDFVAKTHRWKAPQSIGFLTSAACFQETIGPDPHSPGSPLPASAYAADIGYLVDGTDLAKAGNAINHAWEIQMTGWKKA